MSSEDFDKEFNNAKQEEAFDLREFLLDLAERKEIENTPSSIKKASQKSLERIYEKYKAKPARDTNEMICDMLIVKTSDILETIGWIKSASETARKLQGKKLFMRDFSNLMSHVTPNIAFLGFVEGGLSVAEDVGTHAANTMFFPKHASGEEEVKSEE